MYLKTKQYGTDSGINTAAYKVECVQKRISNDW